MADTTVKFFHSGMAGAPVLNGVAGAMIGLLDACLVNGFGSGNVDSIVIASGVATVTRSAGHPFEVDTVALIAGATVTGGSINGEQKVTSVTTTTYTFACPGISNQTATGTITHKLAPAGFAKTYSGTNLAAYKASDVTATGCLLRVSDTGTTSARVVGYESMGDVNTGTGAFPTSAQQSGGLYWPKSNAADSTSRPWILFADSKSVYLMSCYSSTSGTTYGLDCVFGDFLSTKSSDAYGCLISGFQTSSFGTAGNNNPDYDYCHANTATGNTFAARSYSALGSAVSMRRSMATISGDNAGVRSGASGDALLPYPNYTDGGLYVCPHSLVEEATSVYRGKSPGFYPSIQAVTSAVFANLARVSGVTGLTGKTLMAVNSFSGVFFFDITGPWR